MANNEYYKKWLLKNKNKVKKYQKEYQIKWRKLNNETLNKLQLEYKKRNKLKVKARYLLRSAMKFGKIEKSSFCENNLTSKCKGRIEAHHDDYDKPLKVKWLCRKHHLELHTKQTII